MAIPFMKNEAEATRDVAFWSSVAITIGLAAVSLFGIWAEPSLAPEGKGGGWIILGKLLYSFAVVGAEFLTAVALYRALIADDWRVRGFGLAVFVGLAWFCVHNVERGIHRIYPVVFDSDGKQLRALAALADTQATAITTNAATAAGSIPEQLAQARTDLSVLQAELTKITASSTETSIKVAQQHLQGLGYYDGNIDGKWEVKTRDAVLRRGDEIRAEMGIKKNTIAGLEGGTPVTTTATASDAQSKIKIENEAKARKREEFGRQITAGAWVLESARSLTFVVFIAGAGAALSRRRDEIEMAKLDNELADVKRQRTPPTAPEPQIEPEPVAAPFVATPEPEPDFMAAPDPEPAPLPEPDLTDAQRRARAGGKGAQHAREAARQERVLIVSDVSAREAISQKVAAE